MSYKKNTELFVLLFGLSLFHFVSMFHFAVSFFLAPYEVFFYSPVSDAVVPRPRRAHGLAQILDTGRHLVHRLHLCWFVSRERELIVTC